MNPLLLIEVSDLEYSSTLAARFGGVDLLPGRVGNYTAVRFSTATLSHSAEVL
jgi:hypothetical protein